MALSVALVPSTAAAATWDLQTFDCIDPAQPLEGGGGQYDEAGDTFIACRDTIHIYAPDRSLRQVVPLKPYFTSYATDVAPSPDGSVIYLVNSAEAYRMVRQTSGQYVLDSAWHTAPVPWGAGAQVAKALHIATDGYGNLYMADGGWVSPELGTVFKFAPDGTYLTSFGAMTTSTSEAARRAPGIFFSYLVGLGVTRDGSSVFTTEVGNNRVQRFDRRADGTYAYALMFGNTAQNDALRAGSCNTGMMAAPYDVGVDPWGTVYVINASCPGVQVYTAAGVLQSSMFVGANGPNAVGPGQGAHSIAVTGHGDVMSTFTNRMMVRTSADPGPWPTLPALTNATAPTAGDTTAPVVTRAHLKRIGHSRRWKLRIRAFDAGSIASYRVATGAGHWCAWRRYSATSTWRVRGARPRRSVAAVQVRDAAGNVSNARRTTTR